MDLSKDRIRDDNDDDDDDIEYTEWHKKRELLKTPTKIEEIQEKKFIDRNWTITTCLLRDSNPNYQFNICGSVHHA